MRVVCVYREGEDYSRAVEEWLESFYRRAGFEIERINPDVDFNFCETYDVVECPTILALGNNGEVMESWRGRDLPLVNDVMYYALQ